ncbi:hemerythrin [Niastella koreensis]|uniref:Hemerythrin HHE cation binding domain protein n=2 Tax=Niastella koreensis TaxID=354356 RepID=G8TC45_NIAKG|nr:hemerythrin domain-containing protein [Niastella koreensis]AEW00352.1 Hemerythrin HHE cation binding domain protein [Niastella koreensis GR20-10]OQP52220.1 hemerythrin [Niastella koreensis]
METPQFNAELYDRKKFIKTGLITVAGSLAINLIPSCGEKGGEEGQEVSPPEDLMQEHGLLNRILLIYDHCRTQLVNKTAFPLTAVASSAAIVRQFVEDYHEKQEENYLFPRFKKANQLTDLVTTLLQQHQAGRTLTDKIMHLSKTSPITEDDSKQLLDALTAFNVMYRPHEAREDTVLFPAFRKIVSSHEYDSLGEEFEKNEQKLFGEDGFAMMVGKVAEIEKQLGIYELSQFTPAV